MNIYAYRYPRPSVATDIVVFTLGKGVPQVLLIDRREAPLGMALPGGFLAVGQTDDLLLQDSRIDPDTVGLIDASLEACAQRELYEETSVKAELSDLHFIGAYGDQNRDPRGRYVSIAYWTVVRKQDVTLRADTDARAALWVDCDVAENSLELAFDHKKILLEARRCLKQHRNYADFLTLVPDRFTLTEWREICEALTGRAVDRSNFHTQTKQARQKLKSAPVVAKGRGAPPSVFHRPE